MVTVLSRAGIWLVLLLLSVMAAVAAQDTAFAIQAGTVAVACIVGLWFAIKSPDYKRLAHGVPAPAEDASLYYDDVIRWGAIATVFWGVAGFLVGVIAALQLAYPDFNFEPYLNFGRVRPLHTSAVIFAFGGNALLATSFYVVQRTCRARLAFPGLARSC